MDPLPPDVQHVEDLTTAHLGGATQPELEAFRMAVLQQVLHLEIPERSAILLLYGDGEDWRERVAERVPLQWGMVTGEIDVRPPGMRALQPPTDVSGRIHRPGPRGAPDRR